MIEFWSSQPPYSSKFPSGLKCAHISYVRHSRRERVCGANGSERSGNPPSFRVATVESGVPDKGLSFCCAKHALFWNDDIWELYGTCGFRAHQDDFEFATKN